MDELGLIGIGAFIVGLGIGVPPMLVLLAEPHMGPLDMQERRDVRNWRDLGISVARFGLLLMIVAAVFR